MIWSTIPHYTVSGVAEHLRKFSRLPDGDVTYRPASSWWNTWSFRPAHINQKQTRYRTPGSPVYHIIVLHNNPIVLAGARPMLQLKLSTHIEHSVLETIRMMNHTKHWRRVGTTWKVIYVVGLVSKVTFQSKTSVGFLLLHGLMLWMKAMKVENGDDKVMCGDVMCVNIWYGAGWPGYSLYNIRVRKVIVKKGTNLGDKNMIISGGFHEMFIESLQIGAKIQSFLLNSLSDRSQNQNQSQHVSNTKMNWKLNSRNMSINIYGKW